MTRMTQGMRQEQARFKVATDLVLLPPLSCSLPTFFFFLVISTPLGRRRKSCQSYQSVSLCAFMMESLELRRRGKERLISLEEVDAFLGGWQQRDGGTAHPPHLRRKQDNCLFFFFSTPWEGQVSPGSFFFFLPSLKLVVTKSLTLHYYSGK